MDTTTVEGMGGEAAARIARDIQRLSVHLFFEQAEEDADEEYLEDLETLREDSISRALELGIARIEGFREVRFEDGEEPSPFLKVAMGGLRFDVETDAESAAGHRNLGSADYETIVEEMFAQEEEGDFDLSASVDSLIDFAKDD